MANDKGQTTGSVLFGSLAKGLQGLQQGMEQKRQNDLQNLMMAMKVQDAEMNREAFLQSQQLREQQIQNAQQTFKKGQLELNRLADPIGTARREAEAKAEQQAVFNQRARDEFIQSMNTPIPLIGQEAMNFAQGAYSDNLKDSPLPFQAQFDPITGLPTKLEITSPKQFSQGRETDDARLYRLLGPEAYIIYKTGGELPEKDLKKSYLSYYNTQSGYEGEIPSYEEYKKMVGFMDKENNINNDPLTPEEEAELKRLREEDATN